MKDCTFTVEVDGKLMVYDYDGFWYFLMQKGNLAAVAPKFAGVEDLPKAKASEPKKLSREKSAAAQKITPDRIY